MRLIKILAATFILCFTPCALAQTPAPQTPAPQSATPKPAAPAAPAHPRPTDGRDRPPTAPGQRNHPRHLHLGIRRRSPSGRHGRHVAHHLRPRDLQLHPVLGRSLHRRRRRHHRLQIRHPHPRRHRDGPRRPLPLPRHPGRQVRQGREVPPRPARPAAAHPQRRLLAQADLSQPDVARRRLHGRALSGRVRRHLPISPPTSTTSPTSSSSWTNTCAIRTPAC